MHSIIVQVSTKPIDKKDYIFASDVCGMDNGFLYGIADYVADYGYEDRLEGLNWFLEHGKEKDYWNIYEDEGYQYFKISSEQKRQFLASYIDNIFNRCREVLANEEGIKESFMRRGFNDYLFDLENSLKDEFQMRVIDEWGMNMDLESWLRGEAEVDERYYVGNVLDYHF